MFRQLFIITILFLSTCTAAQTVRFEIRSLPANHPAGSPVYLAGSFNGWNPKDDKYRFQTDENNALFLRVDLSGGNYEYKITRGGWDREECRKDGSRVENRQLTVGSDTVVELAVEAWRDHFGNAPQAGTAGKNVQVIDTAFSIDGLNRTRRIWICLPQGYASSRARYPVLYMHDGQNLFDNATSYAGEWGVDECLDSMRNKCIVVGIDNGGSKRMNEYSPYDFSLRGFGPSSDTGIQRGEGALYVDFLARKLKPYIDQRYRTLKNRANTFLAGSSMGGLISMYALLRYPKVFGGAGVFSPSFWIAPKLLEEVKTRGKKVNARIYFYAGKQESDGMVPDMLKVFEGMMIVSSSRMTTVIRDDGKHNESTWRREFPLFYQWLMK